MQLSVTFITLIVTDMDICIKKDVAPGMVGIMGMVMGVDFFTLSMEETTRMVIDLQPQ